MLAGDPPLTHMHAVRFVAQFRLWPFKKLTQLFMAVAKCTREDVSHPHYIIINRPYSKSSGQSKKRSDMTLGDLEIMLKTWEATVLRNPVILLQFEFPSTLLK
jgi:hypothetical protein